MQKSASSAIKFLFVELSPDQPLECRHWITGGEQQPLLQKSEYLLIGLCREGAGVLLLEERIYSFHPGNLILIPPETAFCLQSPQHAASKWEILFVQPKWLPPSLIIQPVFHHDQAARTLSMLLEEWYQAKPFTLQAQQLLLELFFLQLRRALPSLRPAIPQSSGKESLLPPSSKRPWKAFPPPWPRWGPTAPMI